MKRFIRTLFIIDGILVITLSLMVVTVSVRTKEYRIANMQDLPEKRVAIVFGANVRRNGSLSPILQDRVNGGIELYRAGKVQRILMTGDNSTNDYNEVAAMKAYAVKYGVPEEDIVLDYAGFNTYDSCYRARMLFAVREAILVTQRYHQPRAVFTCRGLGIDAVGWELPDFEKYPNLRWPYSLREYAADIKAVWEVGWKVEPTVLGPLEPPV